MYTLYKEIIDTNKIVCNYLLMVINQSDHVGDLTFLYHPYLCILCPPFHFQCPYNEAEQLLGGISMRNLSSIDARVS